MLLMAKNLWRQGYLRCPTYCSDDTEAQDCMCSCPAEFKGDMTPYEFLLKTNMLHWLSVMAVKFYEADGKFHIQDLTQDKEDEVWAAAAEFLCNTYHPGEMYSSASPYDPTFWPIHPSAERFLNKRRLSDDFDDSWGYDDTGNAASDTGIICDWTEAVTKLDLPTCRMGICRGHNEDDLMPFISFDGEESIMTNSEFYAFIHPSNEQVPYVYDSFDYSHCEEDGYIF